MMATDNIRDCLSGGDRRSIGAADQWAVRIAENPALFGATIDAILDADPVIRMRAADAAEKASRGNAALLLPHTATLLGQIAGIDQKEVQWHVLQMLPRLTLTDAERAQAVGIAERLLRGSSRIVAAHALSALFALLEGDAGLRYHAVRLARGLLDAPAAALRARARFLLSTAKD
jgi:hypothetical protein